MSPVTMHEPISIALDEPEKTHIPTYPTDQPAYDTYQRRIDYLRVALTDRCNMRCVYCMPEQGMHFLPHTELLTDDELLRVLRAAAAAGFRKIRLTGGEPTLRPHLIELVHHIKAIPGIEQVAMTTNALHLPRLALPLKQAGLDRVNISIDSLDPQRLRWMTRGGSFARVWEGIEAAVEAGLQPIKLNAVIVRGMNDNEVVELAALTLRYPWEFRFIEVMPMAGVAALAQEGVVSSAEIVARIEAAFGALEPVERSPGEPSRCYALPGAVGKIGFISSVSDPFCETCNRMRLSADGRLHLCLLRDNEVDLRAMVRGGASHDELEQMIYHAVAMKPWGHGLPHGILPTRRGMSQLGG